MLNKIFKWFSRTRVWLWFARNVMAHFTFRIMGYPSFPVEKFFDLVDLMRKSKNKIYCFASTDHASLASWLIRNATGGGQFSHAGLILPGTPRGTKVLHMMGAGVVEIHALSLLREIDYLAIVEVELTPEGYKQAYRKIQYIQNHKSKFEYDYQQELQNGGHKLYCSEMIYAVLDGLVDDPDFKARNLLGRKVFPPDRLAALRLLLSA